MNYNKKAELGDLLIHYSIYLIFLVLFFSVMFYFVSSYRAGGILWEDFYAKELARVVDLAQPGDQVVIDIQKATEVAKSRGVQDFNGIFYFDNLKNQVCVKLDNQGQTCFRYFNDVSIVGSRVDYGVPGNVLQFQVEKGLAGRQTNG